MSLAPARRRLWLIGLGGVAVLGFLTLAVLHAPPVRARLLAWMAARLEPSGLVLQADRLEYNLALLDVRIHGLRLATSARSAEPFLTADEVHAVLGWGVLIGRIDVKALEVARPRVVLLRTAGNVVNWPAGQEGQAGRAEPDTIHFDRVRISDLNVVYRDAVSRLSVAIAGMSMDLNRNGRDTSGPVHLALPGRVRWNGHDTSVNSIDARVTWNDRDLSVEALRVDLDEGRLQVDGRVQALTADPQLDLRIASDVDLARAAPWLALDHRLSGALHVDASITGSPSAIQAAITARGRDMIVDDLRGVQIDTSGRLAGNAAELTQLNARFAEGSLNGHGTVAIDGSSGRINLDWRQLDVATLVRAAARRDLRPEPAAVATGSLEAQWDAPRLDALRVRSDSRLIARRDPAAAGPQLPLEGPISFEMDHSRLTLRSEQSITSVGDHDPNGRNGHDAAGDREASEASRGARATVDVSSTLDAANVLRSPLSGAVHVAAPDLADLARVLMRAGIAQSSSVVAGTAQGDFSLAGTLGAPRLEGIVDASNVRYGTLDPAAVHTQISATPADIRLADITARLGGNTAQGQLHLSVSTERIDGRFEAALTILEELATAASLPVNVEGTLNGSATLSGSVASPRVAGSMTSTSLNAAGQQIDRLETDVSLVGHALAIDRLCLTANPGNSANVEQLVQRGTGGASCQLEARGRVDLDSRRYTLHAVADSLPVRHVIDRNGKVIAPLMARISGNVDGEGTLENLGGRARLTVAETRWADADIGQVDADLVASGRRVSGDVRAPGLALTANGDVGIDRNGPLAVHGRWEPADFAEVAQRFHWSPPFPISGSASLTADVAGVRDQLENLHVTADLDRLTLDADSQRIQLAQPARLEYDGRIARVRDLRLTAGSSVLTVAGALGEAAGPGLTAVLHGSFADFPSLQRRARRPSADESELPPASGSIDFRAEASGSVQRPVLSGSLRVTDGRVPLTPQHAITGATLAASYASGVLTIDQLRAAFQGAAVEASGRIPSDVFRDQLPAPLLELVPASSGPANVTAQITSVTSQIAAPFADPSTLEQVQAHVDASIALQADRAALDRVNGTVTLNRADMSLSGVSFDQQSPTRLVIQNGRVDVANWDWGRGDTRIVLSGGARLDGAQALDLTARAALDLRLLSAFTGAAQPAGRADAVIHAGGTAADPTVDGFVTLSNGELRMPTPRLIVSDLTGTITLARDTIRLERLWATVNGGETEIAGSVHHRWFKPLDGAITLRGRDAAIEFAGLRAEADADVTATLESRGPVVSGTVTLVRSSYREPLSLTGGLLQALRTSSAFAQPVSRSAVDDVRLDLRVATGEDLLVDNNYAQLAASANLRLIGTGAQPVPIGRAALAEGGTIFFGGNRYRLERQGSIEFANPAVIEPDLDLQAVTRVNAADGPVDITLTLKGTPATIQPVLTSSNRPELSQSDLVSLLVTGRMAADVTAGGYTPGAEELLGYLSGELFGTAGRALGVDIVRVERGSPNLRFDAGLVASETDPGARLTFGKNIGRGTQVVFSQSLRESGGLTWIVSYAPRSQAEVRAVSLDNGDRLYDFRHDLAFGKPPSRNTPATPPPLKVSAVRMSGAGRDENTLRGLLHVDTGERFSFFRWQDDRDRLERFYHNRDYAEARVTTKRSDGGAVDGQAGTEISYDVRPGPHTEIVVEGFTFPRRVIDALKTAWSHAVIDEFLIDEVETVVRGELVDRGFIRASVKATLGSTSDAKQLRIVVDRGPQVSDRRIVFGGNHYLSSERLRETIRSPELARAAWLNPERVRDVLAAVYRSEGYLDASVRVDEIVVEGPIAIRTIQVNEGEPFHLREVRIVGVRALSSSDIVKASDLAAGEKFSENLIDRARRTIVESYRRQGFNSVAVTLRTAALPDRAEVDVDVEVEEGAQQRLRDVVTTGLARTRPELVSRALKLEAGQPVNLAEWSSARRRLYETGVFRSVDIEPEPLSPAEPRAAAAEMEQPIRARVTLEEWPALRLRYGLEVQDEQSAAGDPSRALLPEPVTETGRTIGIGAASDLTVRNLLGRGLTAGVAGRYTRDFRAARTFLTVPSLFGLPVTSNIYLSRSREQLGETGTESGTGKFVTDLTGVTLEQRLRPVPKLEVSYGYTFEHNHTFDLHPDPFDPLPFDVLLSVARLASTALFDTRNDLVDATRGWFHSSHFEYGPASLGSDRRFVKYLLQQRYYRATGPIVIAGAGRVGLASAFGQSLIPSERYFAGGGNSVRGYAENVLSPHDRFDDLVGGGALIVLNSEVRFPVFKIVRGVGFFDAGRAFDAAKDIALADLSAGTGVGLRVQTPVVLLRLDFGVPLDGSVGPRRGRWFFSVGQAF